MNCTYEINFVLKSKCCVVIAPRSWSTSSDVSARASKASSSSLCLGSWLVQEHWADHRRGALTAATFEMVPVLDSLDSSASFVDGTTPSSSPVGSCLLEFAVLKQSRALLLKYRLTLRLRSSLQLSRVKVFFLQRYFQKNIQLNSLNPYFP